MPGPWEHRTITANGSRFHLAEAGTDGAPLVVLLHDYPQFWWAWRNQIPALAAAGYHVAAMDLRGFGASDKSPRNIATPRSCFDVAGVVSALGYSRATVVGHGVGALAAWSMTAFTPEVTTAVVALSAPHPLTLRRHRLPVGTAAWLQWIQAPWFPERSITLELTDDELAARRDDQDAFGWRPVNRDRPVSNALKIFASLAQSADKGAARRQLD